MNLLTISRTEIRAELVAMLSGYREVEEIQHMPTGEIMLRLDSGWRFWFNRRLLFGWCIARVERSDGAVSAANYRLTRTQRATLKMLLDGLQGQADNWT